MTIPQPIPNPPVPDGPMTRDRMAAEFTRILILRYGEAGTDVVTALVLVAGCFAAREIELYARPPAKRWGPR